MMTETNKVVEERIKAAKKLEKDVNRLLNQWDERSSFVLKGVGNLSRADLDLLLMYAETIQRQGNLHGFMKPLGYTGDVLTKYGFNTAELVSLW